ncbi:CoA transferase [Rhodobacteraceae bacterium RKSG542]|uniref:CaiB/BaiF CoA transferase family protein n=1 Tax=Pseudovibrio flavus TaxID=2529854 RepID=UPI0012BC67BA|nr:CaiB/BaiF CoA-transferase family protein [Pseudovibrio flavus]MTI17528.1 CoA transferase [Pseudovibrio flavus]
MKPLEGIRVLDLTNVLAGPFCCHQLVHLGAEVIKVEAHKKGDLARELGADPELSAKLMGVSFLAQNAGKKSITVNLKTEAGKTLLKKLVRTADVLVENFRPGVMQRLGVSYDVLTEENPNLIYCAISGFGQDGPWVSRPAYDQIIQGASGIMSVTGDEESAPLRVGYPIADTVGGLTAAMAISAALNAPKRGTFIDVSMLEATLATMGWAVSNYLIAGVQPTANGNENLTSAPSGTFQTRDGLMNIAANKQEQWELLAKHLGVSHLLEDERFKTREARKKHRFALKGELEQALSFKPASVWEEELNAIGIPSGAVLSVPEILQHPQITERGILETFEKPKGVGRDISLLKTGIKLDGEAPSVDSPPPLLGADTNEILTELGYSPQQIETLRKEGAI